MKQLFKFGLILGSICLVATLVLAVTYEITSPKIKEQFKNEEQRALREIVADADTFTERSVEDIEYFEALKGERLVGYCIRINATGYSGYIRLVVGISPAGQIKGVKVLEHRETPGLGAKINETRPGEDSPWFLRQFAGKSAGSLALKENIDAVTGATISSKAVTDSIREKVEEFLSKIEK